MLRASLSGTLQLPANPDLDPALIRRRIRLQSRRHLATAAVLLIAVSLGGLGGWHAREATQPSMLPMADAMQAFRLFAQDGVLPADYRAQDSGTMQAWLDRYFNQAHRLPDLSPSGFKPVSGRLLNTEQGTAAMVLYEDPQGRRISFYDSPTGSEQWLPAPRQPHGKRAASAILVRRRLQLCGGQPGGAGAHACVAVLGERRRLLYWSNHRERPKVSDHRTTE